MGLIETLVSWWCGRPSDAATIANVAQQVYDNDRTAATIFDHIHGEMEEYDRRFSEIESRIEIGAQNIAELFESVNGQSMNLEEAMKKVQRLYSAHRDHLNERINITQRQVDKLGGDNHRHLKAREAMSKDIGELSARIDGHEKDCLDYDVVIQQMEDDITTSKAVIERQQKQIDKLQEITRTLSKEAFRQITSPPDPLIADPPKKRRVNKNDDKSWVADNSKSAITDRMINGPKITMKKGSKSK